jgi:trk system potassium uptake protein TrkA
MSSPLFVVIVGCGRLGSNLANRLSNDGHGVVVIDCDESAFVKLSPEYSGFRVDGDATQLAVLRQAKVDKADVVIAATHDDNVNLMVAQVARSAFSVARVIARVSDPKREEVYRRLGIQTVCPTSVAAHLFLDALQVSPTDAGKRSEP